MKYASAGYGLAAVVAAAEAAGVVVTEETVTAAAPGAAPTLTRLSAGESLQNVIELIEASVVKPQRPNLTLILYFYS